MSDGSEHFTKNDGIDLKDLMDAKFDNLHSLIDANDKNYNQRFENVIAATKNALNASDRAVSKAEMAAEKRFDSVNEFRNTLADQQRTLMPRSEAELQFKSLTDKIESLSLMTISRQGEKVGVNQGWQWAIGVLGLVSLVTGIILAFAK